MKRLVEVFEAAVAKARESAIKLSYPVEGDDKGEVIREHFGNLARVFEIYCDRRNWRENAGRPLVSLPVDFANAATGMFGHLAAGDLPAPMKDALRPGRRAIVPGEARDIKIALMYVEYARKGKVDDQAPVRTVTNRFGVSPRSYQLWAKQFPIDDEFPALDIDSEDIEQRMTEAAERYLAAGRGRASVNARDAKRKV